MKELASTFLEAAIAFRANDIYLLCKDASYQVLLRNSQERKLLEVLSLVEGTALISHFKFLAGMNVGEKRRVQQGAVLYEWKSSKEKKVLSKRLRLSTVGDFQGQESLVIRMLSDSEQQLDFHFFSEDYEKLRTSINRRGLYLFAGPVGSGKTSLMYRMAREQFLSKQVITIEDPVEIIDKDFLQLSRNDIIGNDYDSLIKLSLRHMPDLVIVGEIRDSLTARAVIRASLTGYTVFSTIHARSISGVYQRLLELGLTELELKNTLNGIVYQRLLAGKGLIDYAEKDFAQYSSERWNKKIDRLVEDGYLSVLEGEKEKISSEEAD